MSYRKNEQAQTSYMTTKLPSISTVAHLFGLAPEDRVLVTQSGQWRGQKIEWGDASSYSSTLSLLELHSDAIHLYIFIVQCRGVRHKYPLRDPCCWQFEDEIQVAVTTFHMPEKGTAFLEWCTGHTLTLPSKRPRWKALCVERDRCFSFRPPPHFVWAQP